MSLQGPARLAYIKPQPLLALEIPEPQLQSCWEPSRTHFAAMWLPVLNIFLMGTGPA